MALIDKVILLILVLIIINPSYISVIVPETYSGLSDSWLPTVAVKQTLW